MEFKQTETAFYLGESLATATAKIEYEVHNEELNILHTQVSEIHKGQGIGKLLVKEVIDYARANNLSVLIACPFAKKEIEKHEEYQDLIKKSGN